jgi:glycosyltransferase involved in cell wall biosynthesis
MNETGPKNSSPNQFMFRACIPPVPDESTPRPLWSVMIPTYNCAKYLRETLASVLAQASGPEQMQIEVVDDCSTTDDPQAVVQELGCGRVSFYCQPRNVGHTRNFETCLQRARGRLVHQLHGDDCVREGFYAKMEAAFREHPDLGAAFCRTIYANHATQWTGITDLERGHAGILENCAELLATGQRIQTPSVVVKRSVYEHLGGFDRRLSWTEDWEMWVRIAAHYPIWFEPEPLAIYRMHDNSSTYHKVLTGENLRDAGRCFAITSGYFPPAIGARVRSTAARSYAKFNALPVARQQLVAGNAGAAWYQIIEALKLSPSLGMLSEIPSFVWLQLLVVGARIKRGIRT